MSVIVHAQGIKTVHAGGGSKNVKILSTLLLNDPLASTKYYLMDPIKSDSIKNLTKLK